MQIIGIIIAVFGVFILLGMALSGLMKDSEECDPERNCSNCRHGASLENAKCQSCAPFHPVCPQWEGC